MVATMNRLNALTVRDVMSRDVATIAAHQTLGEAAEVLRNKNVTGAPVVDEAGRLVGIIAAIDFLPEGRESALGESPMQEIVQDYPGGPYHVEQHERMFVHERMSSAVQTVDANLSLVDAAKCLCLEHIHRVIVVDESARPVGVLTSLDIVAALVHIVEEQNGQ